MRICRENIEWADIRVAQASNPKLPKVLLIGDSIALSYYNVVTEIFKGSYACGRVSTSKCVGDPVLFKELDLVLSEYEFDTIHFNNGMHGWDYTEDEYAAGLAETLDYLIGRAPGSMLVWANTTPVRCHQDFNQIDEKTDRVIERNRLGAAMAVDRGLPVSDLFSQVIEHPEYHRDGVHFNELGQKVLGTYVADIIVDLHKS